MNKIASLEENDKYIRALSFVRSYDDWVFQVEAFYDKDRKVWLDPLGAKIPGRAIPNYHQCPECNQLNYRYADIVELEATREAFASAGLIKNVSEIWEKKVAEEKKGFRLSTNPHKQNLSEVDDAN